MALYTPSVKKVLINLRLTSIHLTLSIKLFTYLTQKELALLFRVITLKLNYIIHGFKQNVLFDFVYISHLNDCFVGHCEQILYNSKIITTYNHKTKALGGPSQLMFVKQLILFYHNHVDFIFGHIL